MVVKVQRAEDGLCFAEQGLGETNLTIKRTSALRWRFLCHALLAICLRIFSGLLVRSFKGVAIIRASFGSPLSFNRATMVLAFSALSIP